MRTKAERRKNDFKKAKHKKYIVDNHYGFSWYDNLHQYSKNKIHCSCPLCTAKTNMNRRYVSHSDALKLDSMDSRLDDMNQE